MEPYKYSVGDTSIVGALYLIFGVTGAFIFGFILDKTKRYLFIYRLLCTIIILVAIPVFWTLPSGHMGLFAPNICILGFFLISTIPIGFAFSVEIAFPVSEALSNGVMNLAA